MKKKTKKALIIGGSLVAALFLVPIIINKLRPKGTVNPYLPQASVGPSRVPMSSAPTGERLRVMGLWG